MMKHATTSQIPGNWPAPELTQSTQAIETHIEASSLVLATTCDTGMTYWHDKSLPVVDGLAQPISHIEIPTGL